ncbi:short-chain dehydrogenase [bacterium]|nr:MAG: short-chain dehydrogenase [bacterium]
MNIKDSKVMVLGGWGLVGMAVCRRLLERGPSELIILSLKEQEAKSAIELLKKEYPDVTMTAHWGDMFVRESLKDVPRAELLKDSKLRKQYIEDIFEKPTPDKLRSFFLSKLIIQHKPNVIVDCVNSATGLAYQDIFTAYYNIKPYLSGNPNEVPSEALIENMERFLGTVSLPQLIRHIQVLNDATRAAHVKTYVKIGTTGTGGMGLNIPYTHSEDKPSGQLLSKSSLAGAHSLLLFLMGRTPDSPYVKEIKPAAVIAWKRIAYGEVLRGGKPIPLVDCDPEKPEILEGEFNRNLPDFGTKLDENFKSVFIDTGENGIFSTEEFYTITANEQMEFVTPEEIAQCVIWEIEGGNSGFDVVGALDSVVMGPTYRAGVLREAALDEMKRLERETGTRSIAFEMLGPPHLSKLLYEAHIIRLAMPALDKLSSLSGGQMAEKAMQVIREDKQLRSRILSIGVPILLPDGKQLLRGPEVKIPSYSGSNLFEIADGVIDEWAAKGWVDLRSQNMEKWKKRILNFLSKSGAEKRKDTSSGFDWASRYDGEKDEFFVGKIVTKIFIEEEEGGRIKA